LVSNCSLASSRYPRTYGWSPRSTRCGRVSRSRSLDRQHRGRESGGSCQSFLEASPSLVGVVVILENHRSHPTRPTISYKIVQMIL
jgi:hypothetical protein